MYRIRPVSWNLQRNWTELGVEIVSTGGTYHKLKEEGIAAMEISELDRISRMS